LSPHAAASVMFDKFYNEAKRHIESGNFEMLFKTPSMTHYAKIVLPDKIEDIKLI